MATVDVVATSIRQPLPADERISEKTAGTRLCLRRDLKILNPAVDAY